MVDKDDIGCLYFKASEFENCSPSCSWLDMEFSFLAQLDSARHEAGVPFVLTSAYRSKDYERLKGRKGTSSHCKGVAVDIRCRSSAMRFKIIHACLNHGIHRIGVYKHFLHVDADYSKPSAVWYGE